MILLQYITFYRRCEINSQSLGIFETEKEAVHKAIKHKIYMRDSIEEEFTFAKKLKIYNELVHSLIQKYGNSIDSFKEFLHLYNNMDGCYYIFTDLNEIENKDTFDEAFNKFLDNINC